MKTILSAVLTIVIVTSLISCNVQKEILYVGTYSQRESQGIYVYEYERETGAFKLVQTKPEISDPNFIVIHPNGKLLYTVNTIAIETGKQDQISSFTINQEDGSLSLINQIPAYGRGACHISLDKTGNYLFVSHYSSGSLAVFSINKDGSIKDTIQTVQYHGVGATQRQRGPNVHSILVSPDNRFVYVADLGLDKVMIYELDQKTGMLSPAEQPFVSVSPGAGPRHFTFHPEGPYFYLAQEMGSKVSAYKRDPSTGALTEMQTLSTLPEGFEGRNSVADIHTDPKGKYLYVSNRGHNSLAIYSIAEDGQLELLAHESVQGDHPRNFMVDPKGEFVLVANKNSDNIVKFSLDPASGLLKHDGFSLSVPAPVCLKWFEF